MATVSDYTALLSGSSWTGGPARQATTVSFSFSTIPSPTWAAMGVGSFRPLSDAQKDVVRSALAQWQAVSGIAFVEAKRTEGTLTFGLYRLPSGVAGEGMFPITGTSISNGLPHVAAYASTSGGDVAFDASYLATPTGADDFLHVALHEIGHAIGLKHPFDASGNTLAASMNNGSNTVMAYAGERADHLQSLDVAAAQYLYGTHDGASRPIDESWVPATESLTVTGSGGNDIMLGTGGNDIFFSRGGYDAVVGGAGDDLLYAAGQGLEFNGGSGTDLALTGLAYTPGMVGFGSDGSVRVATGGLPQIYSNVEQLGFTNGLYVVATNSFTPAVIGAVSSATGAARAIVPDRAAAGGPGYLQWQFIASGAEGSALSTGMPNVFLHGGSGNDALQVSVGQNVLDGGLGSNFMTGGLGAGTDTFFTDARAPGVVWNTIRNFHAGDAATLWGYVPGLSSYRWETAAAGAAGSEGATLRANIVGGAGRSGDGIDASITFAGVSVADAQRFQVATGVQPAGAYLYITNAG